CTGHPQGHLSMFSECEIVAGFHPVERDTVGSFVWTEQSFRLRLRRDARFARLKLCYNGERGALVVRASRGPTEQVPIHRGWHDCVLQLHDSRARDELSLWVEPLVAVPGDARQLGVMLRELELFDDPARYARIVRTSEN